MWWTNAIQWILDAVINNADVISGLILTAVGWRAGLLGWLLDKILVRILKTFGIEGKDQVQKVEDNQSVKEGEELQTQLPTPDVVQKRKRNFLDIIRGKK